MKVAVGTENRKKVLAVEYALKRMKLDSKIIQYNVESNVPKQPFDDDVYQGAKNRALNMKKLDSDCDIYIGIEGGIVCQFGQYFNVQITCVITKDGQESFGISAALPVPKGYIDEIRKTSFSKVVDTQVLGGTAVLTNNYTDRRKLIRESVIMSLTTIVNIGWNVNAKL